MVRQLHVADALPPDHAVLIQNIHVRNKASAAVQFIRDFVGVGEIRIGHLHGKDAQKFKHVGFGIAR